MPYTGLQSRQTRTADPLAKTEVTGFGLLLLVRLVEVGLEPVDVRLDLEVGINIGGISWLRHHDSRK